jgi:hypothetical protein
MAAQRWAQGKKTSQAAIFESRLCATIIRPCVAMLPETERGFIPDSNALAQEWRESGQW